MDAHQKYLRGSVPYSVKVRDRLGELYFKVPGGESQEVGSFSLFLILGFGEGGLISSGVIGMISNYIGYVS